MGGTFACPECGARVEPARVGKGRQVRCEICSTLLEVPYFPRSDRRRRPTRPVWVVWAIGSGLLLFALVGLFVVGSVVQMVAHSVQTAAGLNRNRLSRAEAEKQLAAADSEPPERAVRRLTALLPKLERDPALAEQKEKARAQMESARQRLAVSDLAAAQQALSSNPAQAVALAERVCATAATLHTTAGRDLEDSAQAVAGQVAEQLGIVLVPARGRFRLGLKSAYEADLLPLLTDEARRHGYISIATDSPLRPLWEERARYQLTIDVTEDLGDFYLQSKNRISLIDATIALTRNGVDIWHGRISSRTQVPLQNLRAYEAQRLALSEKHNPDVEQRFYKDAYQSFRAKLVMKLREFPDVSN